MRLSATQRARALVLLAAFCWTASTTPSDCLGQERLDLGGQAFFDYFYSLSDTAAAQEGLNGFRFRRVYLTADYDFSEAFSSRIRFETRLEENDPSPQPFVKDLYVRWTPPSGHRVTLGIAPTPGFEFAENAWGFRSVEQAPLDFSGVLPSRDFGVRVDGPLLFDGSLRYDVMFGNNSGFRQEMDKYKRIYGSLDFRPGRNVMLGIGGDYGRLPDEPHAVARASAVLAYVSPGFRIGATPFFYLTGAEPTSSPERLAGAGIFAVAAPSDHWSVIGRLDRIEWQNSTQPGRSLAIVGVAYRPIQQIGLIPNLHYIRDDGADPLLQARATVEFSF